MRVFAVVIDIGQKFQIEASLVDDVLQFAESDNGERFFVEIVAEGFDRFFNFVGEFSELP